MVEVRKPKRVLAKGVKSDRAYKARLWEKCTELGHNSSKYRVMQICQITTKKIKMNNRIQHQCLLLNKINVSKDTLNNNKKLKMVFTLLQNLGFSLILFIFKNRFLKIKSLHFILVVYHLFVLVYIIT